MGADYSTDAGTAQGSGPVGCGASKAMAGRYALLIGNEQFLDPALSGLRAPQRDVDEFATVLEDTNIGAFERPTKIFGGSLESIQHAIHDLFDNRQSDDILLL